MKLAKKIFIFILIPALFSLTALFVLNKLVSPGLIKHLLRQEIAAVTHEKVDIAGNVSWQLFPRPFLKIPQLCIGRTNSSQAPCKMYIDHAQFSTKIIPLLHGKLVLNQIVLKGVQADWQDKSATRLILKNAELTFKAPDHPFVITAARSNNQQLDWGKGTFPLAFNGDVNMLAKNNQFAGNITYKGTIGFPGGQTKDLQSALQQLQLNGSLTINNVRYNQLQIAKIQSDLSTAKGTLLFNPLKMDLYGGNTVGNLALTLKTGKLSTEQTATALHAEDFFQTFFTSRPISGPMNLSLKIQGNLYSGSTLDTWQSQGTLSVQNGTLNAINLQQVVAEVTRVIHTIVNNSPSKKNFVNELSRFNLSAFSGETNFSALLLSFQTQGKALSISSFLLEAPQIRLSGHGEVDLKNESLDSRLAMTLAVADKMVNKVQMIMGGSFPLQATGSLSSPVIKPDMQIVTPIISRYLLKNPLNQSIKNIQKGMGILLLPPKLLLNEFPH